MKCSNVRCGLDMLSMHVCEFCQPCSVSIQLSIFLVAEFIYVIV